MAEVTISITAEDGTQTTFKAIKEGSKTAFDSVSNAATSSVEKTKSAWDNLKSHWLEITASITAAWVTVSKSLEYINLGAKAMQSEETFKNVTKSYGEDADQLLAKMKQVSAGIIDDSALMQRSIKALQQGLSANQIVQLLEVARSSARVAGTDIVSAFDGITNAVANQATRGLKLYGIVIDQKKAFEDYATALGTTADMLSEQEQAQALANATIAEGQRQMAANGPMVKDAWENIQEMTAKLHELKETIGKDLIVVIGMLWEILKGFPMGVIDYFRELNKEMEVTRTKSKNLLESNAMSLWGRDTISTLKFMGIAISAFTAAAGAQLIGLGSVILNILTLNLDGARKAFHEMIIAGDAATKILSDAWKNMLNSMVNARVPELVFPIDKIKEAKAVVDALTISEKQRTEALKALETVMKNMLDLESKIKGQREGYADLELGLKQKLMTEDEKYYSTQERLDQKFQTALTLTGQAKIDALTDYQTAVASSAQEVIDVNGNVVVTLEQSVASALDKIKTAQNEVETEQGNMVKSLENETTAWHTLGFAADEAVNKALTGINEMTKKLEALTATPHVIKMVIQQETQGDTTGYYTVPTLFESENSMSGFHSLGGYAKGTDYVPKTGMYMLHQGEAVIPASQNNKTNITLSPTIQIIGSNKNGRQLAKEIDEELADMYTHDRSRLKKVLAK